MSTTSKAPQKKKLSSRGWRTAAGSDVHELYELSVQDPDGECELIDQVWSERRGRQPSAIREDFCGTAAAAMAWVKRRPKNTAIAVDLDPAVLGWAKSKLPSRLSPAQARRLTFVQGDVTTTRTDPVDSILALNFSYFIFKQRPRLVDYFKHCLAGLVEDGMLMLDAYGGSDSHREMSENRDMDGFTYVWDQALVNPINGDVVNHIHFKFPDGTRINRAFTYDWRLWSLQELRDALLDAGFRSVAVYWEGTDEKTMSGDGVWTLSTRGEACPGWIAYIVAEK